MKPRYFDIWVDGKFKGFIVVGHENGAVEIEVAKVFGESVTNYEAIEWMGVSHEYV